MPSSPSDAPPITPKPSGKFRRILRAVVSIAAWALALAALAGSTLWLWSGYSYTADLIGNLGAQMLLACIVLAIALLGLRRWRALFIVLLACVLLATPLLRHRAAYWPKPIDDHRARAADEVRFFHYNDSGLSPKAEVYAIMERSGADIVEILSPPVHMQFDVIYNTGLEDKYPGKLTRQWAPEADGLNPRISPGFVVSRWPITRFDCTFLGPLAERFMAGVVERPAGRFAIVAVHPRSPRNPDRWTEGNRVVEKTIELAVRLRAQGLPLVILSDLNSSPTGSRSLHLCSAADLRRAKPLLVAEGTYPDVVPLNIRTSRSTGIPAMWPASIAIDDALVSPEIEVTGWRVEPRLRSEHCPVTIELRIPAPIASGTNPGGR